MFKKSANELKSIRCVAVTGVLVAAYVVLKAYAAVTVTASLRISFAFLALAAIGMLFGPAAAVIAAIPCDIAGALLKGSGILPVFTFIIMFEGFIYGVFLYGLDLKAVKKSYKLIAAQGIVVFVSHLVFNTAALYFHGFIGGDQGTVFTAIAARAAKNLIEFPIDIILLYIVLTPIKAAYKKAVREG